MTAPLPPIPRLPRLPRTGGPAVDESRLVALARRLVRTRSDNPNTTEQAVVRLLAEVLADSADEVRIVQPVPSRPNLLARYGRCDGSRPTLLLTAATDTVPADPDDWRRPPYQALVAGGELWGRGTADMKGGIAAAVEAALVHHAAGRPGPRDLLLVFTADGERGGRAGWQALADTLELPPVEGAVVLAPTGLVPHRMERGVAWLGVDLQGREAPASRAEDGVSAVLAACRLAELLPAAAAARFAGNPAGGPVTTTLGRIDGGTRVNTVPGGCRTEWDLRLPPGGPDVTEEAVRALVAGCLPEGVTGRVELLMTAAASESPVTPLWERLVAAGRRAHDDRAHPDPVYPGPTDARTLRRRFAVPAYVCGPGEQRLAHGVDERVPVAELRAAAELCLSLLRE
ncbi:acetylornithine deacetylase [Kitasatospora xanthocidica]|uniref:M20 family metallopeptidase n=1 Tax=Kitasatospora xanthocidica TaxID=83382 RepID=UPI00167B8B00|nr:M20/M25/M40 family metallo-hydrolase [Kitasatospora xanthocidica]GHF36043.1 acetylornithine deacetylase [Kitasatospora xanthocidica]